MPGWWVGMILVNTSPNSLNADFHSVPTVHLPTRTEPLSRPMRQRRVQRRRSMRRDHLTAAAPFTASFSSRGPLRSAGDLLKPDVIAPGQDILAGVAPPVRRQSFDLFSGTSMSSPHVAGLAALVKESPPGVVADGDQVGAHDDGQ